MQKILLLGIRVNSHNGKRMYRGDGAGIRPFKSKVPSYVNGGQRVLHMTIISGLSPHGGIRFLPEAPL